MTLHFHFKTKLNLLIYIIVQLKTNCVIQREKNVNYILKHS